MTTSKKKKTITTAFKITLLALPVLSLVLLSNSGGRDGFNTGSPGEFGNTCTQCHNSNNQDYGAQLSITTDIPATGYELNTAYTVTVDISSSATRHGFLINAERLSDNNDVGTFTAGNNSQTFNSDHVTHINSGSTSWTFTWTSPATEEGQIKFYAAAVAGKGNGQSNDQVVTATSETIAVLSAGQIDAAKVQIFPNPVEDYLEVNITNDLQGASYTLFDLNGKQLESNLLNGIRNILDLSKLQTSSYILEIKKDNKKLSRQILKK
ncbi:MAG: choice-of-anchor V domain-containing protein [Flavicella sp.]